MNVLQELQARTGWTDATLLDLIAQWLEQEDDYELLDFLEDVATEEGSDEMDD